MSKHSLPARLFENSPGSGSSMAAAGGENAKVSRVRLSDGAIRLAEVHWYEAHGIGRKELKIKRHID